MKKINIIAAIAVLALIVVVSFVLLISLIDQIHEPTVDPVKETEFKAAVLIPGPIVDGGWNRLAYEGIQEVKHDLSASVNHVITLTPTDQEAQFREFALDGYNVIFGHGYEFQDPAKLVAGDFPDAIFITSSGGTITDNISPMVFRLEQATYLFGVIAGQLTESNKIGIIGGQNIPAINSKFQSFIAGIKYSNPDVTISWAYVGDWTNIGKAKELAQAQIDEGIDIIFPNAGAAELGAYEVIKEHGLYTFGAYLNRTKQAPDSVIVNGIVDPEVFVYIARLVKEGNFEPKSYPFNLVTHPNIIKMEWNPKVKRKLPIEIIGMVAEVEEQIRRGKIVVPQIDFGGE